jgi:dynein light intermediate chain 1
VIWASPLRHTYAAMASSNNRTSTYTQVSTGSDHDRPKSSDAKKDMWSSMLDGVASGKRLPEKNIIVLGMLFGTLVSGIN